MRQYTQQTKPQEVLVALQCDRCHKTFDPAADIFECQEFVSLRLTGGYGAVLGDGSTHEIDLCQRCVVEVLGPWLREVDPSPVGGTA